MSELDMEQARNRRHVALLVQGGIVLTPNGPERIDVACADGRVVALGDLQGSWSAETVLNATGLHVLHVTTTEEMAFLEQHKRRVTVEVTPHHLTMHAPECYERLGSLAQMNPPVRERQHQNAMWQAIREGVVDVIGSDHAPHMLEEKARPYPESPSGMTGVQIHTILRGQVMLRDEQLVGPPRGQPIRFLETPVAKTNAV